MTTNSHQTTDPDILYNLKAQPPKSRNIRRRQKFLAHQPWACLINNHWWEVFLNLSLSHSAISLFCIILFIYISYHICIMILKTRLLTQTFAHLDEKNDVYHQFIIILRLVMLFSFLSEGIIRIKTI